MFFLLFEASVGETWCVCLFCVRKVASVSLEVLNLSKYFNVYLLLSPSVGVRKESVDRELRDCCQASFKL